MQTNPEFIPSYLNQVEFLKDEALATQLNPLANLTNQLNADLKDTVMLAGSEALQTAMLYYGQVKEGHKNGIPTARPIYDDLSERFSKKRKK